MKYKVKFNLVYSVPVKDFKKAKNFLLNSTADLTEFVNNDLNLPINKIEWRLKGCDSGHVHVDVDRELTHNELLALSEWISGQCADGIGESFEQNFVGHNEEGDHEYDDPIMCSFDWKTNDYTDWLVYDGDHYVKPDLLNKDKAMIEDFDINEAFKELELVESALIYEEADKDLFNLSDPDDIDGLYKFLSDDKKDIDDEVQMIVDIEAEEEADLKEDYTGNVVLQCLVCAETIYKAEDDLIKEENKKTDKGEQIYNAEEECPHCKSLKGFKLIGKVASFIPEKDRQVIEKPTTEEKSQANDDEVIIGEEVDLTTQEQEEKIEESVDLLVEDFHDKTKQGYKIVKRFKASDDRTHVIAERKPGLLSDKDYIICLGYDDIDGTWAQGRYGYDSLEAAEKALKNGDKQVGDGYDVIEESCKDGLCEDSTDVVGLSAEICKQIFNYTKDNGGGTFDLDGNSIVGTDKVANMYAVGVNKLEGLADFIMTTKPEFNDDYCEKINKVVDKAKELGDHNLVVGTWIGPNAASIDLTRLFDKEDEAIANADPSEEWIGHFDANGEYDGGMPNPNHKKQLIADKEVDELDEKLFNNLVNKYIKEVYENTESYETTSGSIDVENNKIVLEGVITFKSGNKQDTKFVFESFTPTKSGKIKSTGFNKTFSTAQKAFTLKCDLRESTLVPEALNYNYKARVLDESKNIFGRVVNRLIEEVEDEKPIDEKQPGPWDLPKDDKKLDEGFFRGTPGVEVVFHGQSDPDIVYDNYVFNYWDIEDTMWQNFTEHLIEIDRTDLEDNEEAYDKFVQDNCRDYLDDLIAGGYNKKLPESVSLDETIEKVEFTDDNNKITSVETSTDKVEVEDNGEEIEVKIQKDETEQELEIEEPFIDTEDATDEVDAEFGKDIPLEEPTQEPAEDEEAELIVDDADAEIEAEFDKEEK